MTPFTNFLADIGAPFARGLRRAGLPVHALDDVNNFIPSHRFWRFLVDMAYSQDIPDLGFHVGQRYGANCADPHLADVLRRSPTLYQGLLRAIALINRTVSHCQVGISHRPGDRYVYFHHEPSCDARNPAIEQIGWFGIMTLIGIVREFTGPKWHPNEIGVMVNHPPSQSIREGLPNSKMLPGRRYSYIAFEETLLTLPPPNHQAVVPEYPRVHHETIAMDFVGSVRQVLHSYISCEEDFSLNCIATVCETSTRNLQRRLAEAGTNYSEMLDRVRFDIAKKLLQDGRYKITEISQQLGYSNATHFARAFRRIAGVSPSLYRQQYSRL